MGLLRRCPRAYAWEKIERRPESASETLQQIRGNATHKAIEEILKGHPEDAEELGRSVVARFPSLDEEDVEQVIDWVLTALDVLDRLDGHLLWVERLLKLDRGAKHGWILWAAVDCAVETASGLHVIDWKTTSKPTSEPDLEEAPATGILRLVAGANSACRPIHIVEAHLPSASVVTVTPDQAAVAAAYSMMDAWQSEFADAFRDGEFPARTGSHCGGCAYRRICPVAN